MQTYTGGMWDGSQPTLEELGYSVIWHTDRLHLTGYITTWYETLIIPPTMIPYVKRAWVPELCEVSFLG